MTTQAKQAAELSNSIAQVKHHLVTIINHADYPHHLCVAIDPQAGVRLHHIEELLWLVMCIDPGRVSTLFQLMFAEWAPKQAGKGIESEEIHQIIAIFMFLEALDRHR
jgi:hypothetical protein